jgi:hypothetical protein
MGNKKPPSVLQHREGLGRFESDAYGKSFHWYDKRVGYSWLHYDDRLTTRTQMSKNILGLDLGSNSIGWALLEEHEGKPDKIIGSHKQ